MTPKELLLAVKTHIIEEPLRLNMHEGLVVKLEELEEEEKDGKLTPSGIPPCGTVGCIAGWCCILSKKIDTQYEDAGIINWFDVKGTAAHQLGFDIYAPEIDHLFYPALWPEDFKKQLIGKTPGTREYAEVVAAHIDAFITEQGW